VNQPKSKTIPIIGLVLFIVAAIILSSRNAESNDLQGLTITLALLAVVLIPLGNYLITHLLDRIIPWQDYKVVRFVVQVLLGMVVSLSIINGLYFILKEKYTDAPPDMIQLIQINMLGAALVIPIISVYFGVKFLRAWNKTQLEAERLQKENARSQMMNLRNHLDPHFLFNNLNILSSLIDHDIDLSKKYLDKFAEVYRTILKSELSDLTTLSEEMKLIEAYIYLIKIRWQDALKIEMDVHKEDLNRALPPLSAQMLIENVIKHNTISKSSPMVIKISTDTDFIVISNTKRPKKYSNEKSSGTGLANIQNRYAYFTDRKLKIAEADLTFSVSLPLLKIDEN